MCVFSPRLHRLLPGHRRTSAHRSEAAPPDRGHCWWTHRIPTMKWERRILSESPTRSVFMLPDIFIQKSFHSLVQNLSSHCAPQCCSWREPHWNGCLLSDKIHLTAWCAQHVIWDTRLVFCIKVFTHLCDTCTLCCLFFTSSTLFL